MRGRRILTEVRGLREQTAKDRETKLEQGAELGQLRANEKRFRRELAEFGEKNVRLSLENFRLKERNMQLRWNMQFCAAVVGILAAVDVLAVLWWVTR